MYQLCIKRDTNQLYCLLACCPSYLDKCVGVAFGQAPDEALGGVEPLVVQCQLQEPVAHVPVRDTRVRGARYEGARQKRVVPYVQQTKGFGLYSESHID